MTNTCAHQSQQSRFHAIASRAQCDAMRARCNAVHARQRGTRKFFARKIFAPHTRSTGGDQIPLTRRDTFIADLLHYRGAIPRPAAPQQTGHMQPGATTGGTTSRSRRA
jgi:hypothetical protein